MVDKLFQINLSCRVIVFILIIVAMLCNPASAQFDLRQQLLPEPHFNVTEYFGYQIATSGNFAAVSVPGNSENNFKRGYVQLLEHSSDGWVKIAKLRPSVGDFDTWPLFSFGMSIDMDENTVVATHPTFERNGAVFLFEKPESGWVDAIETAILRPSEEITSQYIGNGVAVHENTVIVGDWEWFNSPGHVLIYEKPETGWVDATESATVKVKRELGIDQNLDVHNDVIVVGSNPVDFSRSSVTIFQKLDSGWTKVNELFRESQEDSFGHEVKIHDNFLVISAAYFSGGADFVRVFAYQKGDDGWSGELERVEVHSGLGRTNDSYLLSMDINENNVLIGTTKNIYLYEKTGNDWNNSVEKWRVYLSDQRPVMFASALSIADSSILISDYLSNSGGFHNGTVYSFERQGESYGRQPDQEILPDMYQTNVLDQFGYAVDIEDNIAVVSSYFPLDNGNGTNTVHVYEWNDTTWMEVAELTPSDDGQLRGFGNSVSISNDVVAVGAIGTISAGAYTDYVDNRGSGKVYLYQKPAGGWHDTQENAILSPSDPSDFNRFGRDVEIVNDNIIVSASLSSKQVYVFKQPLSGWTSMTETQIITSDDEGFGRQIQIDGNTLLIAGENDLYIYERVNDLWDKPT
ncbi:MAG: hypothetical protein AAFN93_11695, partial [Bacteroidota bacterium]